MFTNLDTAALIASVLLTLSLIFSVVAVPDRTAVFFGLFTAEQLTARHQ